MCLCQEIPLNTDFHPPIHIWLILHDSKLIFNLAFAACLKRSSTFVVIFFAKFSESFFPHRNLKDLSTNCNLSPLSKIPLAGITKENLLSLLVRTVLAIHVIQLGALN